MTGKQWFCTRCKYKFETDRNHPFCPNCDSGYVLLNEPVPAMASTVPPADHAMTKETDQ